MGYNDLGSETLWIVTTQMTRFMMFCNSCNEGKCFTHAAFRTHQILAICIQIYRMCPEDTSRSECDLS